MSSQMEQYVIFSINHNLYAIPIKDVSEIVRMKTVKWVPQPKEEFLGVIHLRDHVIPIISLHKLLLEEESEIDGKTRMILIQTNNQEVGFFVDEVDKIDFLSSEYMNPTPHLSQTDWIEEVYHHEGRTISMLNIHAMVERTDFHPVSDHEEQINPNKQKNFPNEEIAAGEN